MNNSFNYTRFSLLVKRQWVENKKLFLMASFALFGLGVIFYSLSTNWEIGQISDVTRPMFLVGGLYIAGSFFTNYLLKDFADKNASTNFLLIPASHLEKLLSVCVYSFFAFPILIFIIFFVTDYFFVHLANSVHASLVLKNHIVNDKSWQENELWYKQMFEKTDDFVYALIGSWFITQTFTMVGSIMFIRWSYIKTAFIGFAVILTLILCSNFVMGLLIGEFDRMPESSKHGFYLQVKPTRDFLEMLIRMAMKFVFTPILLLIAFLKLKEKQV
ncbi:hypothetical protein LV89_04695 [Arcicella aurantiaca]|uniref:ABC-2 type transport system permease protein n=1 Tax=Arcicella aurantiaca TaxID=591202 RepID=A0A316DJJ9_9BACT|nr:hypothetical protein [Arcicella aurantiaca]PWK16813.1 hypothetical protein LV89_04695 [Arcicella aurantiaca]